MAYRILSDIVPEQVFDKYLQAVEEVESYGLKEHSPFNPWKRIGAEGEIDHYWTKWYWRDAVRVACPHYAYVIPAHADKMIDPWGHDELPAMKKRVEDAKARWATDADELRMAYDLGIVQFGTSCDHSPTCVVGSVWFFFAGSEGDGKSWQVYRDEVGIDTMLEEVAAVLNNPIEYGIDGAESASALYSIREGLHDEYVRKQVEAREKEKEARHKEFLKKLEGYTTEELQAEIERRNQTKEA